ncbi:hypothetical protein BDU57DRAFT_511758 [Ampelomyces quisqualis]|uniref:Uncharacterized protein n=1 Tax=Ampelomyces quisqualis TaxID=50730 RepID=A0A6A5QVU7_AMPQU|nr:hypothetical protein BDU57DRAFT_511758 [Ampelomyces quisqualis]
MPGCVFQRLGTPPRNHHFQAPFFWCVFLARIAARSNSCSLRHHLCILARLTDPRPRSIHSHSDSETRLTSPHEILAAVGSLIPAVPKPPPAASHVWTFGWARSARSRWRGHSGPRLVWRQRTQHHPLCIL